MTVLSFLYTVRPFFLIFFYGSLSYNFNFKEQSRFFLVFPLFLLSFFSIMFGYFFEDFFIGSGINNWEDTVTILSFNKISPFFFEFLYDIRFFFPLSLLFLGFFFFFF